jgi:dipeptidyl aminopeptidase/acylaminoacyl peptidase
MDDLMAAVDAALERFDIDESRLGVVGGSYGGYMTNWIIGHTDRFACACTQRTVSMMEPLIWGDFGWAWGHELGAWPWEDPERYRQQSPITYATDMNTPLLILQGLADHRTPADQGERLFVTLRVLGKPVEMVLFPEAGHDLSRNGPPRQRVERLRVIHEWFDRHLMS